MRKKQTKSERYRLALRKHEKWLRSMGAHKEQRLHTERTTITVSRETERVQEEVDTSKWSPTTKKQVMRYSGKRRLLGIATLHKSNLVPVFEKEELQSIGKMRR